MKSTATLVAFLFGLLTLCLSSVSVAQVTPSLTPIPVLLSTLDANPDILHNDYTPSVWGLCAHGLTGARAAATLLNASNEMTRLHAYRVIECALSRHFGVTPRDDADYASGTRAFHALLASMGNYDWRDTSSARAVASRAWETWLSAHEHDPAVRPDHPGGASLRAALESAQPAIRLCARTAHARTQVITVRMRYRSDGSVRDAAVLTRLSASLSSCVTSALRATRVQAFTASTHEFQAAFQMAATSTRAP